MIKIIKKGFTLIELLIVITIIGILTAVVTTNLSGARSRARDTRRKSDLRAIEQSLRLYYNDAKSFPTSDGLGNISIASWGSPFTVGTTVYMSSLPLDPSGNGATYKYSGSSDQYILQTTLENLSDPDIAESQARCSTLYSLVDVSSASDYVVCVQ
jgi:general secretion pathway protein G